MDELDLLKRDLQISTSANDDYLKDMLKMAELLMMQEGIKKIEKDLDIFACVKVHYAAYLFRKRGASSAETVMPRYLRYELNNLLISQKASNDV